MLPVLGLVPFGFTEFSFMADRHVYLASIGIFLVASLGLSVAVLDRGRVGAAHREWNASAAELAV